jgi:hypothetical protein
MDRRFNGAWTVSPSILPHTRWWTVFFLAATRLPLDVVDLTAGWHRTRAAPGHRRSEALAAKAEELNLQHQSACLVYAVAWRQLTNRHPEPLAILPPPPRLTSFDAATHWITNQLAVLSAAERLPANIDRASLTNAVMVRAWLGEFEALIPQAQLRTSAERLQALVEEQGRILPSKPKRGWRHWPGIRGHRASLGRPSVNAPEDEQSPPAVAKAGRGKKAN